MFRNGNAGTNPSNDPFTLSAIRLKWDLGFASLFSNTSYYDRNQRADFRLHAVPARNLVVVPFLLPMDLREVQSTAISCRTRTQPGDNGYATFQDDQRNFYQEFRLSSNDTNARILWTGGLFYSHLSENVPEIIIDPTLNQEILNWTGGNNSLCFPGHAPCPNGLISNGPTQQVDRQADRRLRRS